MLSTQQRSQFESDGIIKLAGAFTENEAARMRAILWEELKDRYGMLEADPATWSRHAPTGLKATKRHLAFQAIFGSPVHGILDDLLGPGQWTMPSHAGKVLVTMPSATQWRVPRGHWHTDLQYRLPRDRVSAVMVWALFGRVAPGGGGTVQLAGSHRLMARYLEGRCGDDLEYTRIRDGFIGSHPWLKALTSDDGDPERNSRYMVTGAAIDGVPLRVVELTGEPGDVFVTHPWVMHAAAPNATGQPRMMRNAAVYDISYVRHPGDPAS